jgi:hypothetical protein
MKGFAIDPPLKRKTSSSSVRRKLEASDGSMSKNPATKNRLYKKILQVAGIHMGGGPGITDASRALCKSLFEAE